MLSKCSSVIIFLIFIRVSTNFKYFATKATDGGYPKFVELFVLIPKTLHEKLLFSFFLEKSQMNFFFIASFRKIGVTTNRIGSMLV